MKTKQFLLSCLFTFMAGSTLYAQHLNQTVFSRKASKRTLQELIFHRRNV